METTGTIYPNQHTSIKDKKKPEWYKPTYDYVITKANSLKDYKKIKEWLDAANGIVDTSTIQYAITPLVAESGETFEYPGEIRETDLINSVREKNLGEYIELPYRFHVAVSNPDAVEKRNMEVTAELIGLAQSLFVTMIEQMKEDPNSKVEVPNFEKYAEEFAKTWLDERAIQGQNILELINDVNNFEYKRLQSFFYWWATEEFYTYREIINNEVYTHVIHPLEGYPLVNSEAFVEDYDGFVIKKAITWEECLSKYKDKIPNEQKDYFADLQDKTSAQGGIKVNPILLSSVWMSSSDRQFYNNYKDSQADVFLTDDSKVINEYTIIWRTEREIKIISRMNPTIGLTQEIVEDDYVFNPNTDLKLDKEWLEEVWIGKRLGEKSIGIYLEPEPCPVQRYDKHRNKPKLPVGGKQGLIQGIKQNPIPARMIPYNIIDRLITLNIERAMSRYRDSITVIPQSMLNNDSAGTYKEKMFFIKADGLLVYDDKQVDMQTVAQGFTIKSNAGLENYFTNLINLRSIYRNECLEIANMNPERMGQIDASAGKANTEQNIYRAKLGSLLLITIFNQALERDHNADLEFSKVAYAGGKVGTYFDRASGQNVIVNIDPDKHLDSDYGVFVRNTKLEDKKIQEYKNYAFSAAQNGEFELASAAIDGDTIPELKKAIKEINAANKQLKIDMENAKNEALKYQSDTLKQIADDKNQFEREKLQLTSETQIRVAEINNEIVLDNSEIKDFGKSLENIASKQIEQEHNREKLNLEAQNIDIKKQELGIKRKQLASKSKK